MIVSDWGRAALIGLVPLAWAFDFLSIWLLFAVAMAAGALTLVFDVAYRSYLPGLVGQSRLVEANSKLELSRSGSEVAGPGVAGLIVQVASAPVALIVDAVSFVLSALSLHRIKAREPEGETSEDNSSLFSDARDGITSVSANPVLRALLLNVATIALFNAMLETVYLLYAVNRLDIEPGLIGLIFAIGGVGAIVGAMLSGRVIKRIGIGRAIIAGTALIALSDLVWPLVGGGLLLIILLLVVGQIAFGFSLMVFNVGQVSLRQQSSPDRLQGRTHAAFRVVTGASIPAGALIGGLLGETVGLRETLFIAVAGEAAAVIWLIASPVRSLRTSDEGLSSD